MPESEMDSSSLDIPLLRSDLEFFPAPAAEGGEPVWTVFDPVNSEYLKADWQHYQILIRLDREQTLGALIDRIERETTIRVSQHDMVDFLVDLNRLRLLNNSLHISSGQLSRESERKRQSAFQWLIHHYLYFRLPLIRPDSFLNKALPYVTKLVTLPALVFYAFIAIIGLYFLCFRFDEYVATLTDFLNWKGALAYGVAITLLKCVHEFAHAFTAKKMGNRVKTMGVAFIVMWPVPYCDVTDSWRMSSRKKRLLISFAGVLAELTIAAFALVIWGVSEGQITRSVCFVLSSVSLAGTLMINLNPVMRFDGYYILSDLLGIDNLFPRARVYLRWFYRYKLLGISAPDPERKMSEHSRRLLLIYSVSSWIYRFFLYTGIAILVYYSFPKIIGIVLFTIEITAFILFPAVTEIVWLWNNRKAITLGRNTWIIIIIFAIAALWFSLPLPRRLQLPAQVKAVQRQILYAPISGVLTTLYVKSGDKVKKGELLLSMASVSLEKEIEVLRNYKAVLLSRINSEIASTTKAGSGVGLQQTALSQVDSKLKSLLEQLRRCSVYAQFPGFIENLDNSLQVNSALYKGQEVALLININKSEVVALLPHEDLGYLKTGKDASFLPAGSGGTINCKITKLSDYRQQVLDNPALASLHGGPVFATNDHKNRLRITGVYYPVYAEIETDNLRSGQTGSLIVYSSGKSYLYSVVLLVWRTILRESGL